MIRAHQAIAWLDGLDAGGDAVNQAAIDRVASLFAEHGDAVHAYAQSRAGAALAADIVSDTFVVAWRRRDDLPDAPLPWLLATARRVAATHLRSRRRQESLLRRMQAFAEAEPELAPETGLDSDLLQALDDLGERDREALLLVAWFDLTNAEAASVQGCRPGTFAVRLHRSRQRMRERLERGADKPAPGPPPADPTEAIAFPRRDVR
jgi:RNA polymerase sigma-70 factor (ECF subfamily)